MRSHKSVQIYIKSPNSLIPKGYHIYTTPEASIATLKQQIYANLSFDPLLEDQRLIFQGKLLSDEELIKDVLRKVDMSAPQVFHLVVKSGIAAESLSQTSVLTSSLASSQTFLPPINNSFLVNSIHDIVNIGAPSQYQHVLINGLPYLMQVPNPIIPNVGNSNDLSLGISSSSGVQEPPTVQIPRNLVPPETERVQRDRQLAQLMWLVFRLLFFAYLFGQGIGFEKTFLISLVLVVVYLYQAGRLRVVRIPINQLNPENRPDILPPPHDNQAQSQQDNQATQSNSLPQELPRNTLGTLKVAIFAFFRSIIPSDRVREFQPEEIGNDAF